MRAITFTLILMVLAFTLIYCERNKAKTTETPPVKTTETPKELLKYSIYKEDISDIPVKTQVSLSILIEDKEINEQKIKVLLSYLYSQTIIKSGFKYHRHPTNIYIYAFTSKDKAESGMGQWIGMISKGYDDTNPKIEISAVQLNALKEVAEDRWGLTQKQRLEIWNKIIQLEDRAQMEADKKIPLDKPGITLDDMNKNVDLMRQLKAKYEKELAKEYGINKSIIDSVGLEGLKKGWAMPKFN